MPCCICSQYAMSPNSTALVTGPDGREFCLFHAPRRLKHMDTEAFNVAVFNYIDTQMASTPPPKKIVLDGFIFPGDISFRRYDKNQPLTVDMSFRQCVFYGKAVFDITVFQHDAIFEGSVFARNADFHGTVFSGLTSFTDCEFLCFASFTDMEVGQYCEFMRCKAEDNALRFYRIKPNSLTNIMFARQEMRCMSFEDCDWPDELFEEVVGNYAPKGTEATYRSLKQKAADEHDQPMVSFWHYREKRARLKGHIRNKSAAQYFDDIEVGANGYAITFLKSLGLVIHSPGLLVSLDFWYWVTSGFGERERRAGAWLLFLILLPMLLNSIEQPIASFPMSGLVERTLTYIPFTKELSAAGGWPKLGQGVSQLLIALQTTIFAFALRNRFRR